MEQGCCRNAAKTFFVLCTACGPALFPSLAQADPKTADEVRIEFQQQGFKTDLSNFDFTVPKETSERADTLTNKGPIIQRGPVSFLDEADLLTPVSNHVAVVIWKQKSLAHPHGFQTYSYDYDKSADEDVWPLEHELMEDSREQLDTAATAVLSAPFAFNLDASHGLHMLLPHVASVRNYTMMFAGRTMLALHDHDQNAAWTNLLAATRVVTGWQIEPVEVSENARFECLQIAYDTTWQALQAGDWPEARLAQLQHEWESLDVFKILPDTVAFMGASYVSTNRSSNDPLTPENEKALLQFYHERELEMRRAVQSSSWEQMQQLPDITNVFFLNPPEANLTRVARAQVNMRRVSAGMMSGGTSLAGRAAEAETRRRIIITAIALERFHLRHGSYPKSLEELSPDWLKSPLTDFMNGQPLHYSATEDGHFLLYSVGLDGQDDGGDMRRPASDDMPMRLRLAQREPDIVWPLPASSTEVVAFKKEETEAEAQRRAQMDANAKAEEQQSEERAKELRQAAMKKLLAKKPSLGQEPVYQGIPLSSWVDKIGHIERYNGAPQDAVEAIRAIGPKAVPFLLEWMPHPGAEKFVEGYPVDVKFAWWALGTQGKAAIPTLARIISRPRRTMDDYSVWTESAEAISYLGPDAIVPMLTVATNMQGKHELWELLHNFANLGTNGAPAVPALIHWANDPDYWVRDGVVWALGGIGKRPDLAVPVLLNTLEHDSSGMVRRDAAMALGSFGNDSEAVLPELTKTLKDPDWQAREGALSGLGKAQNKPEVVVPLISPFLYDQNNILQRSAAYALRDLGSEAGYRALLQASNAPSSWPGIGDIIYEVQQKSNRHESQ